MTDEIDYYDRTEVGFGDEDYLEREYYYGD